MIQLNDSDGSNGLFGIFMEEANLTPKQRFSLCLRSGKPLFFPLSFFLLSLCGSAGCHSTGHRVASSERKHSTSRANVAAAEELAVEEMAVEVRTVAFTDPQVSVGTEPEDTDAPEDVAIELVGPIDDVPNVPASLRDAITLDAAEQNSNTVATSTFFDDPTASRQGVSLQWIESLAIASHPAIAEARARVESTRGQYIQAGLPFNPVLQYQSDEVGNEGASGLHSLGLSQQIVTANKLSIAQQVQAQEIQKQNARLRVAELTVSARVRGLFARSLVAQQRSQIADSIARVAEESLDSVSKLYEAEEVSKISVLQAKVELEQARIAAENAVTNYRASLQSLAAAAGGVDLASGVDLPGGVDLAGGVLVGDLEAMLVERPWEPLFAELSQMSPEMSLAGSELERAKWSLQLACAQVIPDVTVQAGAGYDGFSDDTFGVFGVSVPLPIRNRNQGNIRSARANVSAASAAIERTALDLQGRLAKAAGRHEVARTRYTRLQQSVIPNAEETFELSRQAFAAGELDYLQLLTAQRTLFNTQLAVLDAVGTASQTAAEIDSMVVRLSF